MPSAQTSCAIPAEVKAAGGPMMTGFPYAYGPEANFAFPEHLGDPKIAWRPKWTAKVRYRLQGNFMIGMPDMSDAMRGQTADEDEDGKAQERHQVAAAPVCARSQVIEREPKGIPARRFLYGLFVMSGI